MIIREANNDDAASLLSMGELMHNESPRFNKFTFDKEKAANLIQHLIAIDNGIVIVAEHEGNLVGMIGGMVCEQFFSKDLYACDFVVYIDPEHRGTSAIIRMIKLFEERAIKLGAKEISLGISTEIHAERTANLYEKLGYKRSGISTIKRI